MRVTYAKSIIVGDRKIIREIIVEDTDEEIARSQIVSFVKSEAFFPGETRSDDPSPIS